MDSKLLTRLWAKPTEPAPTPGTVAPSPVPQPPAPQPLATDIPRVETKPVDDPKLNNLLERINRLSAERQQAAGGAPLPAAPQAPVVPLMDSLRDSAAHLISTAEEHDGFLPKEPGSMRETGLTEGEIEALILKYLLGRGDATGRDAADHVKLPFIFIDELMRRMKYDQLLVYRGVSQMNDYVYQLTDLGRERARRLAEHCTYYGAAPVPLADYIAAVSAQSLTKQQPTFEDLEHAFEDLLVNKKMMTRLGPAVNSGRGMFLFGSAGNGKTSIAERLTRCFGQFIWIPRAIGIDGEIVRLFDPVQHEECPLACSQGLWNGTKIDSRWVRIRRPTIVVGGELTMDNLEVTINSSTGISEAPMQLKSNCGTLVIDDFGRQKMSVDQLLNRWIVPLEKRYDFLNLPNGKKIQVPFDQLIVFSTNLEPRDLVDDAFLRRIPYKIEVNDPTEGEFRALFVLMCPKLKFTYCEEAITYLIETHYKARNRPFRCCHPRDLLQQIRNHCLYQKLPLELTKEYFDLAADNYFSIM